MSSVLERIISYKKDEVIASRRLRPEAALWAAAREAGSTRGFAAALEARSHDGRLGVIAEIKRASPSRGVIRKHFQPAELALAYERGGAACLSVLTDTPSFQGAPEHLVAARASCSLPVLRKDFIVDPYQVIEARALGADAILIVMAAVSDALAADLEAIAIQIGMDVLVEVHDANELDRALTLRSRLIGINNRSLNTFKQSLDVSRQLAPLVPRDRHIVSESAISTHQDCLLLRSLGISSFLIGEALMRHDDVEAATRELLGEAR